MSKFRIAVDIDGVLLDNDPLWKRVYETGGGCGKPHADMTPPPTWEYYPDICKPCYDKCLKDPEVLVGHEPILGAVAGLTLLRDHFDLWVVTTRPSEAEGPTLRWLHNHGVWPLVQDIVLSDNKRGVCDELNASFLIDDSPKNIRSLEGSATTPVVFDAPYNQDVETKYRCKDWSEVVGHIYQAFVEFFMVTESQQRMAMTAANDGRLNRVLGRS